VETKSPRNLKKSVRVLVVVGCTYILLFVVTYTVTKQVTWWFVLGLIYTLIVIFLLRKGCLKISKTLKAAATTAEVARKHRPTSAGFISVKSKAALNSPAKRFVLQKIPMAVTKPNVYATNLKRAVSQGAVQAPYFKSPKSRNVEHIYRTQKTAAFLSAVLVVYFCSSLVFVATLYFPQVGVFTCICAFTMIFCLMVVRILILEYMCSPTKGLTNFLSTCQPHVG